MKLAFIIIPTICYLIQSGINFKEKDYPHALVWLAYALANVGFMWYEGTK